MTESEREHGALSERTREEIGRPGSSEREDMPASGFLGPNRTYPIVEKRDGGWKVTRKMLEAAEKRAVSQNEHGIAAKARERLDRMEGEAEAEDYGTSEGARKAAQTRNHGGGFNDPSTWERERSRLEAQRGKPLPRNPQEAQAEYNRANPGEAYRRMSAALGVGARDHLVAALKQKFPTPQAAMAALGLDSALLGNHTEEVTMRLSHDAALRAVRALKARGMLAMDAAEEEAARELEREGEDGTEANAGMPPWIAEHREDADDEFETEEERREDEGCDRRADDLRRRLGRSASDDEWERSEEEMEFEPDRDDATDRMRARDALRARRADDARRRLGRDESAEERAERERREEAEDRRSARDRARVSADYRRARDRHRAALDAKRRAADAYRKAAEDRKRADDSKRADDVKRADDAMRRHADDAKRADDAVCDARDARMRARDARRAHDRRRAHDNPPPFKGMPQPGGEMVSKAAMDAAIRDALASNDARHTAIGAALEAVRPKVGRIAMDSSIQNEGDVYGRALDVLGVPHAGITQLAALKAMFSMAQRPGGDHRDEPSRLAQDAASADSFKKFAEMFPGAAGIERM